MHRIEIDRSKGLTEDPEFGHNRYHPNIEPVLEVSEGEEVIIETRDAVDGQLPPGADESAFGTIQTGLIHPLTGPVFVKGAEPGDVLEVEFSEKRVVLLGVPLFQGIEHERDIGEAIQGGL